MASKNSNAAIVTIAKEHAADTGDNIIRLSTGVLARVTPVSPALVDEAMASVPNPEVPVFTREDGLEIENPDHPRYQEALARATKDREQAAMDALVMFGLTLVDEDGNEIGAPEDDKWVAQLRYLAKRGRINLDDVDFKDPIEREFTYKRHVAITAADIFAITKRSGLREEDVQQALDSFPDQPARRSNRKPAANRGD